MVDKDARNAYFLWTTSKLTHINHSIASSSNPSAHPPKSALPCTHYFQRLHHPVHSHVPIGRLLDRSMTQCITKKHQLCRREDKRWKIWGQHCDRLGGCSRLWRRSEDQSSRLVQTYNQWEEGSKRENKKGCNQIFQGRFPKGLAFEMNSLCNDS